MGPRLRGGDTECDARHRHALRFRHIIPLYQRHAQAYDRLRGRSLFEKSWLDAFSALLPAGGTVLDLGCGMGEPIARHLIERGFDVTGIDSSPPLIAMCERRYPQGTWGRRHAHAVAWPHVRWPDRLE
jgi:2-polyprenyl-3-methyl-5-hydroxy-6-metoxy-1,4-benzoquinol methylase